MVERFDLHQNSVLQIQKVYNLLNDENLLSGPSQIRESLKPRQIATPVSMLNCFCRAASQLFGACGGDKSSDRDADIFFLLLAQLSRYGPRGHVTVGCAGCLSRPAILSVIPRFLCYQTYSSFARFLLHPHLSRITLTSY